MNLLVIKRVLAVDDLEHLLVQIIEELLERPVQARPALDKVRLEVLEQVGKHVLVLLVDDSVGALKHLVELFLRARQQIVEEFCQHYNKNFKLMKPELWQFA